MIKLQNIYKDYVVGPTITEVLKNINLEIKKGEFVSIVGPSGSGKSTLMHIIGLLDMPTKGNVIINGRNTKGLKDQETSKLRNSFVGFVFQQFNLINKLTVSENIVLPAMYSRQTIAFNPKDKAHELLERFGMAEKINELPNRLSGGQQQRVAIARALIMNPELILADEPTGNLDTKTGATILDLLAELNKKDHITVIIVTHESEVARKTQRQVKIVDGEII